MTRPLPWLLACASALLVTACPQPDAPQDGATAVTIQLNWLPEPQFGGIYMAQAMGAFAERGLEVTIRKGGPDVPGVQMCASGQVEFALAAADEVLRIREDGGDVVSLFATYQTAPQGLMTYAARGVDSLEGLLTAGGTLAVQPGLSYVEFLRQTHGLDGVELVTYQGGIGQFLAQRETGTFAQQCFVTSEPIAARREGVEPKTFLIAESGFNPYTSVVITQASRVAEQPEVVAKLREALQVGWRAYLDDPTQANEVMRGLNPSMDAETFQAAADAQRDLIETDTTREHGLGHQTLERWTELASQLEGLGSLKGTVAPADCFLAPR